MVREITGIAMANLHKDSRHYGYLHTSFEILDGGTVCFMPYSAGELQTGCHAWSVHSSKLVLVFSCVNLSHVVVILGRSGHRLQAQAVPGQGDGYGEWRFGHVGKDRGEGGRRAIVIL